MMSFLFTPNLLLSKISNRLLSSVFCGGGGAADVDRREHDENEGLQESAEDPQPHHRPGDDEWEHAHEHAGGGMFAEDVPEETHSQRENAREVSDQLDRKHERREPPH